MIGIFIWTMIFLFTGVFIGYAIGSYLEMQKREELRVKELEVEKMKVIIDIPKDFTGDYIADKFKDFFSRVIADIDCKGMCGNYEKEIAEMFLKAFDDSEEKSSFNIDNVLKWRDECFELVESDRGIKS